MSSSGTLDELLIRWQDQRRGGAAPPLAELCADHPSLAGELARRIAAFESMERMLGVSPDGTCGETLAPPTTIPPHLAQKLRPLGYEVLELIDHGGMGVVYKATQIELRRTVALKMIAGLRVGPKQLARFRTEAEAVARLHHANIVQIYEVGEVDGHWYFSMEYVAGGTLAHRLEAGPLPATAAATWIELVARATHHAHSRGIVHRDLKPANILLAIDVPKITDFGLAKRLGADTDHTATGEVIGTPTYMAPEQAQGHSDAIGPACDVYALGAVLYEALTGRPPFKGHTVLETLRQVISDEPAEPRRVKADVPRDLEAICLKCLEKNPARRYASAEALADDLQRFLEGRPVTARRVSRLNRAGRWARRHPAWIAVATLVAVTSAVAAVLVVAEYRRGGAVEFTRAEYERLNRRAVEVAPQAREILHRHCFACHGGASTEGNFNVLDRASLLDPDRNHLVLGLPDRSRLIRRIDDGSMPPEEDDEWLPRVDAAELAVLKDWIIGGAPEFPPEDPQNPTPPFVPYSEAADKVRGIMEAKCIECHKASKAGGVVAKVDGGIRILNHDLLVTRLKVVVPGAPDQSELYKVVTAPVTNPTIKFMPPKGYERLGADEIATIRMWIAAGAPPFPHKK